MRTLPAGVLAVRKRTCTRGGADPGRLTRGKAKAPGRHASSISLWLLQNFQGFEPINSFPLLYFLASFSWILVHQKSSENTMGQAQKAGSSMGALGQRAGEASVI